MYSDAVLRIRSRIRKDPKLKAGSESEIIISELYSNPDPEPDPKLLFRIRNSVLILNRVESVCIVDDTCKPRPEWPNRRLLELLTWSLQDWSREWHYRSRAPRWPWQEWWRSWSRHPRSHSSCWQRPNHKKNVLLVGMMTGSNLFFNTKSNFSLRIFQITYIIFRISTQI